MKKKMLGLVFSLVLLVVATAQILPQNIEEADFTVPERESRSYSGYITFLADGREAECYLNEPNMDIDDDFEQCLEDEFAGQRITNAVDWTGRPYLENEEGVRSFDVNKLVDIMEEE